MAHVQNRGDQWKARVRGPDARERTKTFRGKMDADKWSTEMELFHTRATQFDPQRGKMKFAELAKDVIDSRLNLRPATLAKYESYLRRHLLPRFGTTPIAMIDRRMVQDWVKDMIAAGY